MAACTKDQTKPGAKLLLRPIGYIRNSRKLKFEAPSQPENSREPDGVIELQPGFNFEQALQDLAGFDRIWLLWWFDRNETWRPLVLPPRGAGKKRGVFATRSPHRPNPLGISAVPLLGIEGRELRIGKNDLLDGTPILDIKPYIETIDSFRGERQGWLGELEQQLASTKRYVVTLSRQAAAQACWLQETWNIDLLTRAREVLEQDPSPHRTRRIAKAAGGEFRMGCGAWRLFFKINAEIVSILRIQPGYPDSSLQARTKKPVPQREAQLDFLKRWR